MLTTHAEVEPPDGSIFQKPHRLDRSGIPNYTTLHTQRSMSTWNADTELRRVKQNSKRDQHLQWLAIAALILGFALPLWFLLRIAPPLEKEIEQPFIKTETTNEHLHVGAARELLLNYFSTQDIKTKFSMVLPNVSLSEFESYYQLGNTDPVVADTDLLFAQNSSDFARGWVAFEIKKAESRAPKLLTFVSIEGAPRLHWPAYIQEKELMASKFVFHGLGDYVIRTAACKRSPLGGRYRAVLISLDGKSLATPDLSMTTTEENAFYSRLDWEKPATVTLKLRRNELGRLKIVQFLGWGFDRDSTLLPPLVGPEHEDRGQTEGAPF